MLFTRIARTGIGFLVVWLAVFTVSAKGRAEAPVHVVIDATLSHDSKVIDGTVELRITNNSSISLGEIPLWLYPNRFQNAGKSLNDRMVRWIYPAGESRGKIAVGNPVLNGKKLPKDSIVYKPLILMGRRSDARDLIARVLLPAPLKQDETATLIVEFSVEIPRRRGRFGRDRGVVSLSGGWFPRPLTDLTGRDPTLPPDVITTDVRLALPAGRGAVLHDRVFAWKDGARVIEAEGIQTEALVLVVMDMMDVDEKQYEWGRAVYVHRELRNKRPKWKDTRYKGGGLPTGLKDLGEVDISDRLFDVVGSTADLIRSQAPQHSLPEKIVLVDVPAWDRLVQLGPGPVLVSDRLWRMIPFEKALWFHDLALARVVGAQLAWSAFQKHQAPVDRYVTADVVGSRIAKSYSRDVHKSSKTLEEMIGFASFNPVVDNLLYAPEVPFREVYSQSIEEPDILRDEPWRSMNRLPRGKRILAKLEDIIGVEETEMLVMGLVNSPKLLADEVGAGLGEDPAWFFEQWFSDYPRVNYRLGEIEEVRLKDGRLKHRVEIVREGEVIREPVTIKVTDDDDEFCELKWNGKGRHGFVEWISFAPIDQVEIDPGHRLIEAPELTADHPLADNFNRLPWRPPMLTRLLIWGELTAGEPYIQIGFSLRRRYDVTNSIALSAAYSPRSYGGMVGYYRYFGTKRTPNARTWYLGPSVGVSRYGEVSVSYLPEKTRFGATTGGIGFVIGRDNRAYFYDPRSGSGSWASTSYSLGQDDNGRIVQVGRLSLGAIGVFSPAIRHIFALKIGGMGLVGDPVAAQLSTLSMREILRGFDVDETYGRVGFYGIAEYRHTIFDASHMRAPFFSWFDRFQGALFAGAGTISKPSGYTGLFAEDRLYTEVGYGLRLHMLTFGVQQYIIALDIAFPITPLTRQLEIEQADGTTALLNRNPFKLVFGIRQAF